MVSFDVESLFTDVPIEGAVQAARRKLESDPGLADRTTLTPAEIADLLDFVLRSTYHFDVVAIYNSSDHIVRQTIYTLLFKRNVFLIGTKPFNIRKNLVFITHSKRIIAFLPT